MNFSSDTAAPVHPAILEALAEANAGPAPSYGADRWTAAAKAALSEVVRDRPRHVACPVGHGRQRARPLADLPAARRNRLP